jgi:hypothetical protein
MSEGTQRRSFRSGEVYDRAQEWANLRGETMTDILNSALAEYTEGAERDARRESSQSKSQPEGR